MPIELRDAVGVMLEREWVGWACGALGGCPRLPISAHVSMWGRFRPRCRVGYCARSSVHPRHWVRLYHLNVGMRKWVEGRCLEGGFLGDTFFVVFWGVVWWGYIY